MTTIRIDGVIGWDVLADGLAAKLDAADSADVLLIINSPGGSILEGFSIFNTLKAYAGKITARVDWAGSMASVIAMAADEIVMTRDSSLMMIHRPWSVSMGTSEDFRKEANTLETLENQLIDIYLTRAGDKLDRERLFDMLDDETWLNAREAKRYGLADVVESPAENSKAAALVAIGGGVTIDLTRAAAKINESRDLRQVFNAAESIKDLEGALRDACHLSKADATALVGRIRAMAHGDHGSHDVEATSKILARIEANTKAIS